MSGCRHKMKILKCKECSGMFCTRCIQLENHSCPQLAKRIDTEKQNLEKKLIKVVAQKIIPI